MPRPAKRSLLVIVSVLALLPMPGLEAHAGLLDFLSGGGDKKAEQPAADKAPAQEAKAADGSQLNRCADQILKTRTMSATELMAEMRGLKNGFGGASPIQSMNELFFGAQPVKGTQKQKPAGQTAAAPSQKQKPGTRTSPVPTEAKKATDGCEALLSSQNMAALNSLTSAGGGSMFSGLASSVSDVLLDALISELSYSAIEMFLTQMLDRPDVLSKITVEIPDIAAVSPELRKQTLNLGGYLAAIKGSNLMVESAQQEFDAAKDSYKKVMAFREKAATALKEAILAKQELKKALLTQQAKGISAITEGDLTYVQELLDKSPEDFFKDYKVQQVAIAYLKTMPDRKSDLAELEGAQAEFKGHYGAYARTAVGAGSMVGFSSLFLKKAKNLWEKQGLAGGAVLVPMITQGTKEVGVLAVNVKKVFDASDDMNEGSFLVEKRGEVDKRGISFQKAVARLDDAAVAILRGDVIRDDKGGHIALLYQRSKDSAASMADRFATKAEKQKVADAFELDDPDLFSFQNTIGSKARLDEKKKRIAKTFLLPISGSDADDAALETVQKQLRENVGKYTNGDARRIMFARAAATGEQSVVAGDFKIQIDNLGMEGLNDQMDFLIEEARHATTRVAENTAADKGKGKRGRK